MCGVCAADGGHEWALEADAPCDDGLNLVASVRGAVNGLIDGGHEHVVPGEGHARSERRTWLVIALAATMMVMEITAGTMVGSMALVADGWHMATHTAALLIAALAYLYTRRHARNQRFTFGTGKLGDLGGFASAVVLALIALLIA